MSTLKKQKTTLIISLLSLLATVGLLGMPKQAIAAYSYRGPAICFQTLFNSGSNDPVACQANGFEIEGNRFTENTCYQTAIKPRTQQTVWWAKADCSRPPFAHSYECEDGTSQVAAYNKDAAFACRDHGGPLQTINEEEETCTPSADQPCYVTGDARVSGDRCGEGAKATTISINIGCRGKGNPILDMLFAFIRFLSLGIGIVIVGSIIVAGIQYTASRGDPSATAKALERVQSTAIAFAIYLLTYAILNWLVPAGLFR